MSTTRHQDKGSPEPAERSRRLRGLPGDGPEPRQFSATGHGTFREGFVVEFNPPGVAAWVGNFQPGSTSLDQIIEEPGNETVFIIAGGQGYAVNERSGALLSTYDSDIAFVERRAPTTVTGDNVGFASYADGRLLWRTRRISWDGFRKIRVEGGSICGEAWCFDDTWHSFSVDLVTGQVNGGSYIEPAA
jgi:hypothetical protein